jgi:hypothetical protein
MKKNHLFAFHIDIDGTIAFPRPDLFDADFQRCRQNYIDAGLVPQEAVVNISYHTKLLILPTIGITHIPAPDSVEVLQSLYQSGASLYYSTARNSIKPELCKAIHEMTHSWLCVHNFPVPTEVSFVWDITHKLIHALEATAPYTLLIDDRIAGIVDAYDRIAQCDPQQAEEIRRRVIIVSYGAELDHSGDMPRILSLKDWSSFSATLSRAESMIHRSSTVVS